MPGLGIGVDLAGRGLRRVGEFVPPGYATTAVEFDGTNDYAARGATPAGLVDGRQGLLSFWVKLDAGDGTTRIFIANTSGLTTSGIYAFVNGPDNRLYVTMRDAGNTAIGQFHFGAILADGLWHHYMAAWDMTTGVCHAYKDGVDVKTVTVALSNADINYATGDFSVGASTSGSSKFPGCLSELFFSPEYLDLSDPANRLKFYDAEGKAPSLGADGSTPTGNQPVLYFPSGDPSDNKGGGGNFVITGALAACPTSPNS